MNMSIDGVAAGGPTPHMGGLRPPVEMRKAMEPVAEKLGLTIEELGQRIQGGESLSSIAEAKGIRQADLEAAISDGLKANAPGGMTPPADMAHMIATHVGPPPRMDDVKARFAQALSGIQGSAASSGADISSLLDALMTGDDPDETATAHGLKTDDLLSLLKNATNFSTYA